MHFIKETQKRAAQGRLLNYLAKQLVINDERGEIAVQTHGSFATTDLKKGVEFYFRGNEADKEPTPHFSMDTQQEDDNILVFKGNAMDILEALYTLGGISDKTKEEGINHARQAPTDNPIYHA